jgi:biotin/methionine sulfoxide reductase
VVHETHWTPTARHADVVLPVASTLERDDVAAGAGDSRLRASPRAVPPFGEAREELWIYTQLADRLGADFALGLDSRQWLARIYEEWRAAPGSPPAPPFAEFSSTVAGFGLSDVAGHAEWREPTQWWGSPLAEEYDLHLPCNQPTHRLHSQLDMGAASRSTKVAGREPLRLNPTDAAARPG